MLWGKIKMEHLYLALALSIVITLIWGEK